MVVGELIKRQSQAVRHSLTLQSFGHDIRQSCDGGRDFGEPIDCQTHEKSAVWFPFFNGTHSLFLDRSVYWNEMTVPWLFISQSSVPLAFVLAIRFSPCTVYVPVI